MRKSCQLILRLFDEQPVIFVALMISWFFFIRSFLSFFSLTVTGRKQLFLRSSLCQSKAAGRWKERKPREIDN